MEEEMAKKELTLKFNPEDTILTVVVKIPNELPRVLPVTIDDVPLWLEEEFKEFWKATAERVKNELIRGTG